MSWMADSDPAGENSVLEFAVLIAARRPWSCKLEE